MERYTMSLIGRININDCAVPKAIYRLNAIPIKSPMALFTELEQQQKIHNLYGSTKAQIAKANLRKKSGAGGIRFSNFRLYYKVSKQYGTGTKTEMWINGNG